MISGIFFLFPHKKYLNVSSIHAAWIVNDVINLSEENMIKVLNLISFLQIKYLSTLKNNLKPFRIIMILKNQITVNTI